MGIFAFFATVGILCTPISIGILANVIKKM